MLPFYLNILADKRCLSVTACTIYNLSINPYNQKRAETQKPKKASSQQAKTQ